jgi:hypothetical protein
MVTAPVITPSVPAPEMVRVLDAVPMLPPPVYERTTPAVVIETVPVPANPPVILQVLVPEAVEKVRVPVTFIPPVPEMARVPDVPVIAVVPLNAMVRPPVAKTSVRVVMLIVDTLMVGAVVANVSV